MVGDNWLIIRLAKSSLHYEMTFLDGSFAQLIEWRNYRNFAAVVLIYDKSIVYDGSTCIIPKDSKSIESSAV